MTTQNNKRNTVRALVITITLALLLIAGSFALLQNRTQMGYARTHEYTLEDIRQMVEVNSMFNDLPEYEYKRVHTLDSGVKTYRVPTNNNWVETQRNTQNNPNTWILANSAYDSDNCQRYRLWWYSCSLS